MNKHLKCTIAFILALSTSRAWAQDPDPIGGISYNSDINAYEINTFNKLKDLAVYVNGSGTYSTSGSETTAHDCLGLVFKLTTDISVNCTTAWNSESTEHNFNAIGSLYSYNIRFCGTFDGQDHTISGIRIYHSGNNQEKGLFGAIGNNGHVLNLKLSNTRITCQHQVGAIAGYSIGEVAGCTVMDDVAVHTVSSSSQFHGGVVGYNAGSVTGCVCSATLTVADGLTNCSYFGGIVGQGGTLQDNRAFGVTIANVANNKGAIIGDAGNGVTLTNNGYVLCTVGASTTAIGCNGADVTANNGAVPMGTVTGTDISVSTTPSFTHNATNYFLPGTTITVSYTGTTPDDYYYITYSVTDAQSNPVSVTGNTFTMPSSDATVVASVITPVWSGSGTNGDPYIINNARELDMLSYRVNNNKSNSNSEAYTSLHYRLGNDITYTHTTDWDNVPSTENNFTAIGTESNPFRGFFDGDNHTVSGIRIRVPDANADNRENQGLFGYVNGGTVENLLLADTRITGYFYAGGIVGTNNGGTIQNCHVLDNVDIHIAFRNSWYYGGIAGRNMGSTGNINNCSSSATLSFRGSVDVFYSRGLGGIVGYHNQGTVSNCLSLNARVIRKDIDGTLCELSGVKYSGAVVGKNDYSNGLSNNYYSNFTYGSNVANYGCGNESGGTDVTSNRGAVRGYFITYGENAGSNALTLTIPAHGSTADQSHHVAASGQSVQALYTGEESNKTLLVSYDGMVIPIVVTPNGSFTMPATDATITATNDWSGSGTSGDPYIIENAEQLNMLSFRVNNGVSNYNGKHFRLANDITYSHTTDWDDATSTENNYVSIGITTTKYFKGTLDGQNHTISGIRVYKDDSSSCHGLFGYVNGALVKNLILADTRITGCLHTAGIVGLLAGASEVMRCHVLNTVTIHAVTTQSNCHGGVVGTNGGNVNHCSSAATLTKLQNAYNCNSWGGIVGYTSAAGASVNDNYAYGVTITYVTSAGENFYPISNVGAIAGNKTAGIHRNNYYHNCNVIGNTSNIGLNSADLTNDDGAVPAHFLTYVGNASAGATSITIPAHDANAELTFNIAGAGRSVQALYSGNDENFEAVLTVTQDGTDPAVTTDVIENEYFTMPAGDVTIALKNYNFIKNIEPKRWYAIASPMHDENQTYESIANVTNLATGAYDLFRYSESNRTWENHKKHNGGNGATDNTFTTLAIGSGYIYRNGSEQTLHFTGEPNNEATYSITLSATGSGELKGFNLIGNPYPSALPFSRDHYSLNADGSWTAHTDGSGTIAAGEAVLVHTETNGETITVSPTGIVGGSSKGTLPPLPKSLCLGGDCDHDTYDDPSTQAVHFAHWDGTVWTITGTGTLQAYDITGRELFHREVNHCIQLPTSNFPHAGVYMLRLDGITQKIVIF